MRHDETLRRIDACIEAGTPVPPELTARLQDQPRLRKTAQVLHSMDQRLKTEIGLAAEVPAPAIAERVLAELPARSNRTLSRRLVGVVALAAALLLWVGLVNTRDEVPEPIPSLFGSPSAGDAGVPLTQWLDWRVPLTPERVLREEAERLASDTRRTAASLWSSLPLTSLLTREDPRSPW